MSSKIVPLQVKVGHSLLIYRSSESLKKICKMPAAGQSDRGHPGEAGGDLSPG